jgi:hypothetical protein
MENAGSDGQDVGVRPADQQRRSGFGVIPPQKENEHDAFLYRIHLPRTENVSNTNHKTNKTKTHIQHLDKSNATFMRCTRKVFFFSMYAVLHGSVVLSTSDFFLLLLFFFLSVSLSDNGLS